MKLIFALPLILLFLSLSAFAKRVQMPVVNTPIGSLNYNKLNFQRGIYKKVSGPEHCLEGEFRLLRDSKTGRTFITTVAGIFIDHLDQKVKNTEDGDCVVSHFNVINANNELENTEVQSCKAPTLVSNIRTLRAKFDKESIKYTFVSKDPVKKSAHKTACELKRVEDSVVN